MANKNTSGLIPLGHRILVLPEEVEEVTKSGIVIAVGTAKQREEMAQIFGTVVAIGPTCWADQAQKDWAKVGDKIIFGKYSGLLYTGDDGKEYRIINDLDVVALKKETK